MRAQMSEKGNKILYVVLSLLLAIVFWLYVDNELGNEMQMEITGVPIGLTYSRSS